MNRKALIEIAKDMMIDKKSHPHRETGYTFYHGLRTAKIALNLRCEIFPENSDIDDVIFAAALFHDVGKPEKPHNESGSRIIKRILAYYYNQEDLDKIAEIIYLHSDHGDKMAGFPYYAKLVMDADVIDHDGAMDIWLNIFYSASNDLQVEYSLEYFENNNLVNQEIRNSKILNFELSKKIQQKRFEFEKVFFEEFKKEINGEIY